MTSYNIAELTKLVHNGIQTVESLQQSKEDLQKTYGRSAIQQPGTKARVAAWESISSNNDNTSSKDQGRARGKEGGNQDESKGNPTDDGGHGEKPRGYWVLSETRKETPDKQVRDAKDIDGNSSRTGGYSAGGLPEAGAGEHTDQSGNQESEGYDPDGQVDAGDLKQIMLMDHEMSAAESAGPDQSSAKIRNATTDDFAAVFEEGTPKIHRRLRGITSAVNAPPTSVFDTNPVKKGTAESTVSTLLGDEQLSGNGAIHSVHPSLLLQPNTPAHAENAQGCVPDVSETGSTTQSDKAPCNCEKVEGKIDLLIRDFEAVSKKLDILPEIKEEIKNINKKITNLSLGLSTVENYIKSMMIIIPGSGKQNNSDESDVNPDLRAVIGRDRTRGLKEVSTAKSDLETLDQISYQDNTIDNKYVTKGLDFTRSNAANFVPSEDRGSYYTIVSMIKDEIRDIRKQNELIAWMTKALEDTSMDEMYRIIREALDDYGDSNEESD
nr:MAG: phosphoprotein [Longquan rodent jeilongvirus 2]